MLALIFSLVLSAHSETKGDDWFCKTQSMSRDGNTWSVCGTGAQFYTEPRFEAFHGAQLNFESACKASADCIMHKYAMTPKRLECVKDSENFYKCWQMLEFTMIDE